MTSPLEILKNKWNHTVFRAPQKEIIDAVLAKKDVLALLPTGGGKSICFQIPALLQPGICLVISPLIALMQDQVDGLLEKEIKAATISAGMRQDAIVRLFDNLQFGHYKFLYISPERLQSSFIQDKIKQLTVSLIAIDEAHCISEWGHDFRPSYRNIGLLKELQPSANYIALTASATETVLEDISNNLGLKNVAVFKKSFYRANLAYQFFKVEDKLGKILQIVTKTKAPTIIYVKSRKKTQQIAHFLSTHNFAASAYHGKLSSDEKQQSFENWMSEKTPIMVATNAFGMGIDKSNVKVVVHIDLPSSIENYIQEAGRAGRNGKKSFSVVLYDKNDIRLFREQNESQFHSLSEIKEIYKKLYSFYQIAQGELVETAFDFQFDLFCNRYAINPIKLSNTLNLLINNGILQVSSVFKQKSTVQIVASNKQIIRLSKLKNNTGFLIKTLLRSYGGLFEQATKINEYELSKKAGVSLIKISEILAQLHREEIIDYKQSNTAATLYFLMPREDNVAINSIAKNIRKYIAQKQKKSSIFLNLLENSSICRSVQILNYFNETNATACGICDVCLANKKTSKNQTEQILNLLKDKGALSSKEIQQQMAEKEAVVFVNLQELLAEDKISINQLNQYYIK